MTKTAAKFSTNRLPKPGETCGLVIGEAHKRAALLFDRIHKYVYPENVISPEDVAIPEEVTFAIGEAVSMAHRDLMTKLQETLADFQSRCGVVSKPILYPDSASLEERVEIARSSCMEAMRQAPSELVSAVVGFIVTIGTQETVRSYSARGVPVVPCYETVNMFESEFPAGETLAYQAALANLPVISENDTTWGQVLQFRKDKEAVRKYRSLRLWLRNGLKAQTLQQAIDLIGKKLDDYEWAIKKHGLKTVTGALSQVLEWKKGATTVATAGAAGLVGGPIWSAVAAGMMVTSQIAVSLIDRAVELEDVKRGEHSEVAVIYDARKTFKQKENR